MMNLLLTPPIAFLIFILLVALLYGAGRLLASPTRRSGLKQSTYASGEAPPDSMAAPGYRPFFVIALFFAILHLGVLVLGVGGMTVGTAVYLIGLALALLALIVG